MAQKSIILSNKATMALSASAALYEKHNRSSSENNPEATSIITPGMVAAKLDGNLNTQYPEMGPIVSGDGKTLYFSRVQHPENTGGSRDEEDIWYAEWNEETNSWGPAKNIGAPLNNKYPNFINSVSMDGNTLLVGNVYNNDGSMSSGVSLSHRTAKGWSRPKQLIIEGDANTKQWSGFCLSQDQKVLITAREQRKDTYGDLDLYASFLKADSTWTRPVNLGATVNSKNAESAPFLSADGKTLYFTSESENGYGGLDIYMTRRLDDSWTNWSMPQNLGPKVNTPGDESFFSLSPNGEKIFFTSVGVNDDDYDMFTMVKPGELSAAYEPLVTPEKPVPAEAFATSSRLITSMSFMVIYFDYGKSTPTASSADELYRITNLMSELSNARIEISGHADAQGSTAANAKISAKRAKNIADYIQHKLHIPDNRISVKSYGASKPASGNATSRGRHLNRRVEIKVTYGIMN